MGSERFGIWQSRSRGATKEGTASWGASGDRESLFWSDVRWARARQSNHRPIRGCCTQDNLKFCQPRYGAFQQFRPALQNMKHEFYCRCPAQIDCCIGQCFSMFFKDVQSAKTWFKRLWFSSNHNVQTWSSSNWRQRLLSHKFFCKEGLILI